MTYTVTIESSGHSFGVDNNESILDAALRQGIVLPYGCRNGACGSCMGSLSSGTVEYENGLPPALNEEDAAAGKALWKKMRS